MKIKTGKLAYLVHKDGSKERVRIVYFPLPQITNKDHEAEFYRKHLEPIDNRLMKMADRIEPLEGAYKTYEKENLEFYCSTKTRKELMQLQEYKHEASFLARIRKRMEPHARFDTYISDMIERVGSLFLAPDEKLALVENDSLERFEVKVKYLCK